MIKGLVARVKGDELVRLCLSFADHHRKRADAYREQLEGFRAARVEAVNFTGGDPVRSLEAKLSEHAGEADELEFMAVHVVPGEIYELDRSDLMKIGVIRKGGSW